MWFRSANSHTGPQPPMLHCKAGQMAASDYVHYLQKSLASFGASTEGKRMRLQLRSISATSHTIALPMR